MNPICNSNRNATGLGNGTYCTIIAPMPQFASQPSGTVVGGPTQQVSCQVIESASYVVVAGAGVTAGTVTFQALQVDGVTWYNIASPAALSTTSAVTFNGTITGPFHGLRMVVTGITGGTYTYAELIGTIRSL